MKITIKHLYKTARVKMDAFSGFAGQFVGLEKYDESTGMYIARYMYSRFGVHESKLENFVL